MTTATGKPIPMAEFVAAWRAAATLDEVAERLGISRQSARMRASHARSRGHTDLARLPSSGRGPKLDAFAAAWNESAGLVELLARLGCSRSHAMRTAIRCRRLGYRLKDYSEGRNHRGGNKPRDRQKVVSVEVDDTLLGGRLWRCRLACGCTATVPTSGSPRKPQAVRCTTHPRGGE